MWAKKAKDIFIVSRSGISGQMAGRGVAIAGGAKSDREAGTVEKNGRTARAVHRESCP